MRPRGEERAQAIQIGAVLLFGFLVIALSGYQAVSVPQQNAAVEHNHDDRVARDMVSLRDAVVSAANAGETGAVSVQLGTRYPARSLAVNPVPPTGRLATTPPDDLRVTGNVTLDCAGAETTRLLEYSPSYNEYRNAPTRRYEHTLLYADFGARVLPATDQRLFLSGNDDGVIGDGDAINVVPVRNAYNRTGSDAVSVDVVEGETVRTVISDPTVTLPTRLSESNWSAVLPDFQSGTQVSVGDPDSDGREELTVDFPGSVSMVVYCTPVGIGGAPPSGAADLASPGNSGGGGGGGGSGGGGSGGGSDPTVDSLATSDPSGNNYDVSYTVSDADGDLNNVTLVLEESDGTAIDSTTDYNGPETGSASNSGVTLRYGGSDNPARVRLVAKDAAGNRTEDTEPVP